jgi:hypothetical protein
MGTTILAWLIAILGLLMIDGGVWDVADLWNYRRQTVVPLRKWGIARIDLWRLWDVRYCPDLAPIAHSSRGGRGWSLGGTARQVRPPCRFSESFALADYARFRGRAAFRKTANGPSQT